MKIRLPFVIVPVVMMLALPSCQIFKKKTGDVAGIPGLDDYPFDAQGNYVGSGQGKTKPVAVNNKVPPPLAPDTNYQPVAANNVPPPPVPDSDGGVSHSSGSKSSGSKSAGSKSGGSKSGGSSGSASTKGRLPAVSYTVKQGDTLSSIAQAHGSTVSSLKAANGLSGDAIRVGQQLKVPGSRATASSGGSKSGGSKTSGSKTGGTKTGETKSGGDKPSAGGSSSGGSYTVKSGDSLWEIARRNNTTVAKLKSANGLSTDKLSIGQKLKLP